ncbi:MAG TPA: dihydroxyacetone kinase phosphoryl donor subunit DhaM [Anaerolineaceae bacterium]|jgi:phosphocarrier protein FPr
MVGLVLVSHSSALAEALLGLVKQISSGKSPRIAIAAGVGPEQEEFGTDAAAIAEAIQVVSEGDGVVVLMDLGSAILSAEVAGDLLPEAVRGQVRLCSAAFVEGAIAAAVQASLGSDLDTVCREAEQALQRKVDQLAPASPPPEAPPAPAPRVAPPEPSAATEVVLTLKNALGLHARPAAKFVQAAAGFQSNIQVRNLTTGRGPVSARSLLGVISLGAVRDTQIAISASGPDASQALESLKVLVEQTLPSLPGE